MSCRANNIKLGVLRASAFAVRAGNEGAARIHQLLNRNDVAAPYNVLVQSVKRGLARGEELGLHMMVLDVKRCFDSLDQRKVCQLVHGTCETSALRRCVGFVGACHLW
jgi:hypothetical protein